MTYLGQDETWWIVLSLEKKIRISHPLLPVGQLDGAMNKSMVSSLSCLICASIWFERYDMRGEGST